MFLLKLREKIIFVNRVRNRKKISCFNMDKIFEDRLLLEEGVYGRYMTDEKRNMDQKDVH